MKTKKRTLEEVLQTPIDQAIYSGDISDEFLDNNKTTSKYMSIFINNTGKTKVIGLCSYLDNELLDRKGFSEDNLKYIPDILKVITEKFELEITLTRGMEPEKLGYTRIKGVLVKK